MRKTRRLSMLLFAFAAPVVATAGEAFAADVWSPFSVPANAWVGMVNGQAMVIWERHDTQSCQSTSLGSGGLDDDYQIIGSPGGGALVVIGGVIPQNTVCGFTITPLNYNGRWLDITGQSAVDALFTGIGDTWAAGNGGNDNLYAYSPTGLMMGGEGKDALIGGSMIATDQLYGEGGDDCLVDNGNAHSVMDCGSHVVKDFFEAGGNQANCEFNTGQFCPTSGWR